MGSPERPIDYDQVMQIDTNIGSADSLRACIASILRYRYEQVPDLNAQGEYLESVMRQFAASQARDVHMIPMGKQWRLPPEEFPHWVGQLGVLRGACPRIGGDAYSHDVVARVRSDGSLTIVHDPHPEAAGLASPLCWFALFPVTRGTC